MQFFTILRLAIGMLPVLIATITTLETSFPQGGVGQQKLEALKGIIQAVYTASNDATVPFENLWAALAPMVSAIVALMNFTASTPPQIPPTA